MNLGIDEDELSSCVACGMCLPHCPTYRVTGREAYSPRGRIEAMRAVQWRNAPVDNEFLEFMDTCVQCRGCEPACPSGVPFGHLMEATRATLADTGRSVPRWQRIAYSLLPKHRILLVGSRLLALAQRLRLVPARVGLGRIPVRQGPRLRSTGDAVWLYTGCVMDAWQRHTHRATADLLTALGIGYAVPTPSGCCGALHLHAGLRGDAARLMAAAMASMPADAPILVNSAGCGAALQEVGHILGTPEAEAFSARVVDVHSFLGEHREQLRPLLRPVRAPAVMIQDPCHLRHVQRAHAPVRSLIALVAAPVELDDQGVCCGAGGAYASLQPELAGDIRDRKVAAILRAAQRTQSTCIVSANPGCSQHLSAALAAHGIEVRHPIDLLAEAVR